MNWKLLFRLSLFGLAMGLLTVSLVSTRLEPFAWLIVFFICAYQIALGAKAKYFLHGFVLGLINSVWVTGSHILLYSQYMAHHPEMADMAKNAGMASHPRLLMGLTGPLIGAASGLVLGLFSLLASRIFRKK